jgi:hypothetical protein
MCAFGLSLEVQFGYNPYPYEKNTRNIWEGQLAYNPCSYPYEKETRNIYRKGNLVKLHIHTHIRKI